MVQLYAALRDGGIRKRLTMEDKTPANYEFLELRAICMGDSKDLKNNLTHAQAHERAMEIFNLQRQGKYKMNIITGKIIEPQKIVCYGESGVGKTTLGSQFPNSLIVDAERSSTHIDTPRVFVDDWQGLLSVMSEAAACEFKTIVLDTADWAEMKCAEYICSKWKKGGIEEFGYGKGFTYLEEEFRKLLKLADACIAAGKNVVFLAHQTLRKIEPPDEGIAFDRYEPKLTKKINPIIVEWCDALLFMYRKTYVETKDNGKGRATGGKKRVICANSASFCLAKSRWTGIADEFDADIKAILPYLPQDGQKPAETPKQETPKDETPPPPANAERTPHEKLSDLLALGQFTEAELLAYLYGKNAKKTAYVQPGTEFKDIPADLIAKMTKDANWEKIEASLKTNRTSK